MGKILIPLEGPPPGTVGPGTPNTLAMFGPGATQVEDSFVTQGNDGLTDFVRVPAHARFQIGAVLPFPQTWPFYIYLPADGVDRAVFREVDGDLNGANGWLGSVEIDRFDLHFDPGPISDARVIAYCSAIRLLGTGVGQYSEVHEYEAGAFFGAGARAVTGEYHAFHADPSSNVAVPVQSAVGAWLDLSSILNYVDGYGVYVMMGSGASGTAWAFYGDDAPSFFAPGTQISGLIYPLVDGAAGDVVTTDGAGNLTLQPGGGGAVTSVFGRVGAVVAVAGDYTVAQVTGAAPLASPALTGNPTAPTQAALDDSTKLATTKYADDADTAVLATVATALALKAPLASPALTGNPTAPTAAALDASTKLATTAYADSAVGVEKTRALAAEALLAPLASPALTGNPTAPTQAALDDSTKVATTAYVDRIGGAAPTVPQTVTTVLTDAQIKALPSALFTVLAAPGANLVNVPISFTVEVDATAGAYTNQAATISMNFSWSGGTTRGAMNANSAAQCGLLLAGSKNFGAFFASATPAGLLSDFANRPLSLNLTNPALGNLTGGNAGNTMTVKVTYYTVPV